MTEAGAGAGARAVAVAARRRRRALPWARALAYAGLALGSIAMVAPFVWMLSTALKPPGEAFAYPPQWLPSRITFENFQRVWTAVPFGRYIFNSLFVALSVMLLDLVTASLAAYAFARMQFP